MKLAQIAVGIIAVILVLVIILVVAGNESARMAEEELSQQGKAIEEGAALFNQYCSGCHGPQAKGIPGLCPPLNDAYFFDGRLQEVGYPGSLGDYVRATISGGRLISTRPDQYAGAMPPWAEDFGGPLRPDQVNNLTAFILNYEATAGQEMGQPTPTPVADDPVARGEAIVLGKGACAGCHKIEGTTAQGALGPELTNVATNAETRVPGTSVDDYLRTSILNPSAFVVEGFADNIMPKTYSETLTPAELDDVVAYLSTLK